MDIFTGWTVDVGIHGNSFAWMIAPLCLMWATWRGRNNYIFNGVDFGCGVGKLGFQCCLSGAIHLEIMMSV